MLVSALYIAWVANRATVNWIELILIRIGFSLYSGWLTAALLLNFTQLL